MSFRPLFLGLGEQKGCRRSSYLEDTSKTAVCIISQEKNINIDSSFVLDGEQEGEQIVL